MMPKSKFQSAEYVLLIYDTDGRKITGTGCTGDLARAKSQAYSLLRLMAQAAYVDVKPFVKGQDLAKVDILVRIDKSGQTVPVPEDDVSIDPGEKPQQVTEPKPPTERDVLLARLFEMGHLVCFSEHRTTNAMSSEEDWRNYWHSQPDKWVAHQIENYQPQYDAIMAQLRSEASA